MKERLSISTESYCGKPLETTLHRQDSETLVVLLPGMNYTTNSPLLYYAYGLFEEMGYDILSITYAFQYYHLSFEVSEMQDVLQDTTAILNTALDKAPYKRIILVGKSMGTVLQANLMPLLTAYEVLSIWMTPIPYAKEMILTNRSLVIVGSEDRYFKASDLSEIDGCETVSVYLATGADHSMNTPSVDVSLEYLVQSMKAIKRYIQTYR